MCLSACFHCNNSCSLPALAFMNRLVPRSYGHTGEMAVPRLARCSCRALAVVFSDCPSRWSSLRLGEREREQDRDRESGRLRCTLPFNAGSHVWSGGDLFCPSVYCGFCTWPTRGQQTFTRQCLMAIYLRSDFGVL